MSAERLREAARVLRERAEAATPGPWKTWAMSVLADPVGDSNLDDGIPVADGTLVHGERPRTHNIDYIATVDPAVGLAVADLLEHTARVAEEYHAVGKRIPPERMRQAVAVANAVLGDAR